MNETKYISFVKKYISGIDNIFSENKFYRLLVAGLLCIVIYQTYLLSVSFEQRKTIITPRADIQYTLGTSTADTQYLKAMARSIVDLYLDINTSNIADKYTQLLGMFTTSSFAKYKKRLQSKAADLHQYNTISYSSSLDPSQEIKITATGITAPVLIRKYIGNELATSIAHRLVIGYQINGGQFQLTSLSEIGHE